MATNIQLPSSSSSDGQTSAGYQAPPVLKTGKEPPKVVLRGNGDLNAWAGKNYEPAPYNEAVGILKGTALAVSGSLAGLAAAMALFSAHAASVGMALLRRNDAHGGILKEHEQLKWASYSGDETTVYTNASIDSVTSKDGVNRFVVSTDPKAFGLSSDSQVADIVKEATDLVAKKYVSPEYRSIEINAALHEIRQDLLKRANVLLDKIQAGQSAFIKENAEGANGAFLYGCAVENNPLHKYTPEVVAAQKAYAELVAANKALEAALAKGLADGYSDDAIIAALKHIGRLSNDPVFNLDAKPDYASMANQTLDDIQGGAVKRQSITSAELYDKQIDFATAALGAIQRQNTGQSTFPTADLTFFDNDIRNDLNDLVMTNQAPPTPTSTEQPSTTTTAPTTATTTPTSSTVVGSSTTSTTTTTTTTTSEPTYYATYGRPPTYKEAVKDIVQKAITAGTISAITIPSQDDPTKNVTLTVAEFSAMFPDIMFNFGGSWLTLEQYQKQIQALYISSKAGNLLGFGTSIGAFDSALPPVSSTDNLYDLYKVNAPPPPVLPPAPTAIPQLPLYQPDIDVQDYTKIVGVSSYLSFTPLQFDPAPTLYSSTMNTIGGFHWTIGGWVDESGYYFLWCDPYSHTQQHIIYTGIVLNGDPAVKVLLPQQAFTQNNAPWSSRLSLKVPSIVSSTVSLTLLGAYVPVGVVNNAVTSVSTPVMQMIGTQAEINNPYLIETSDSNPNVGEQFIPISYTTNPQTIVQGHTSGYITLVYQDGEGVIYEKAVTIVDVTRYTSWGDVTPFSIPTVEARYNFGVTYSLPTVPSTLPAFEVLFNNIPTGTHTVGQTYTLYVGMNLPKSPLYAYTADFSRPVLFISDGISTYPTVIDSESHWGPNNSQYAEGEFRIYKFIIPANLPQVLSSTNMYYATLRFLSPLSSSNIYNVIIPQTMGVYFTKVNSALIVDAPYNTNVDFRVDIPIDKYVDPIKLRAYTSVGGVDTYISSAVPTLTGTIISTISSRVLKLKATSVLGNVVITKLGFVRNNTLLPAAQVQNDFTITGIPNVASLTAIGTTEIQKPINKSYSPAGVTLADQELELTIAFKATVLGATVQNKMRTLTIKVYGTSVLSGIESVLTTVSIPVILS